MNPAALLSLLQILEVVNSGIASVAAAWRKGHPDLNEKHPDGSYVITDLKIVQRVVTDATTGFANADALLDRLKAAALRLPTLDDGADDHV